MSRPLYVFSSLYVIADLIRAHSHLIFKPSSSLNLKTDVNIVITALCIMLTAQVKSPMGRPEAFVLDTSISLQLDDSIRRHDNSGLYGSLVTRLWKTAQTVTHDKISTRRFA